MADQADPDLAAQIDLQIYVVFDRGNAYPAICSVQMSFRGSGRGREIGISGRSLAGLVEGADSLRKMQALVGVEISFGHSLDSWQISRSSLPYKLSKVLKLQPQADRLVLHDLNEVGRPFERIWEINEAVGEIARIFEALR